MFDKWRDKIFSEKSSKSDIDSKKLEFKKDIGKRLDDAIDGLLRGELSVVLHRDRKLKKEIGDTYEQSVITIALRTHDYADSCLKDLLSPLFVQDDYYSNLASKKEARANLHEILEQNCGKDTARKYMETLDQRIEEIFSSAVAELENKDKGAGRGR